MCISYSNCKRTTTCPLHELHSLVYISKMICICQIIKILCISYMPQFSFHIHIKNRCCLHHRFGNFNIFFIRQRRSINHNGRKTITYTANCNFVRSRMIQMYSNRYSSFIRKILCHIRNMFQRNILIQPRKKLNNYRYSFSLSSRN